jgi:aminoglycoside 6-adenylyltransferase
VDRTAQGYEQLADRFVKWAQTEQAIRMAFVVGSRARVDHPVDEWSDLDIVFVATDVRPYLSTVGWIENIGNPWLMFVEESGSGLLMERRVLFEDGLDVDFVLMPLDVFHQVVETGVTSGTANLFGRGVRVLLDKDGLSAKLEIFKIDERPSQVPSETELVEVINDFWYHAVWTAKKLRRGELWTAKGCGDSYMKWRLLRMIEWHARTTNGWSYDTWHGGRFLEQWADTRVVKDLCAAVKAGGFGQSRRAAAAAPLGRRIERRGNKL